MSSRELQEEFNYMKEAAFSGFPNDREIAEAVMYIKDGLTFLTPMEDDEAIEAFIQAIEFLTGEVIEYSDL
jgi:hypothetical protein